MRFFLLGLLLWPLSAQTVQVYSEFRRVDSKGEILPQDRGGKPREILSPGFVRNGFHSLRVVVRAPKGKWYTMHIALNPEDVMRATLYREKGDTLELMKQPMQSQGTGAAESFWLDVFVPPLAPVRRVRLEAQVTVGAGWVIYPMEVRVLSAIVPQVTPTVVALPPATESADATPRQALREYLCNEQLAPGTAHNTMRELARRNALQDVALARELEPKIGRDKIAAAVVQASGGDNLANWCKAAPIASPLGPEWYLRVRDFLYREASR